MSSTHDTSHPKNTSNGVRIAVILPVYNTAAYLKECLQSILNQAHQNYVVFAVNDGSTDESLSILQEFSQTTDKIVLINTKNNGVSHARNKALERIETDGNFELITFCDSDDIVSPKLLSTYADARINHKAHFITIGYQSFDKNGLIPDPTKKHHPPILITDSSILKFGFSNYLKNSPACSRFTGNICLDAKRVSGLRFDTTKRIAEDQDFRFRALLRCEKSIIISDIAYFYRIRKSSLSHTISFNTEDLSLYIKWLTTPNCVPITTKPFIEKLALNQWQDCVKKAHELNTLNTQWDELKTLLKKLESACTFSSFKRFTPKMIFFRLGPIGVKAYFSFRKQKRTWLASQASKLSSAFD